MHDETLICETLDEYKLMVDTYSLDQLMDIQQHIDEFDYPERKEYVRELIPLAKAFRESSSIIFIFGITMPVAIQRFSTRL